MCTYFMTVFFLGDIPEEVRECRGAGSYKVQGRHIVQSQIWALFIKRFHNVRRSKKGFVSEVIITVSIKKRMHY